MIKRMIIAIDAENAAATPHKDVSIPGFKCGLGAEDRYLLPVRHKRESPWICTQCLPSRIHG